MIEINRATIKALRPNIAMVSNDAPTLVALYNFHKRINPSVSLEDVKENVSTATICRNMQGEVVISALGVEHPLTPEIVDLINYSTREGDLYPSLSMEYAEGEETCMVSLNTSLVPGVKGTVGLKAAIKEGKNVKSVLSYGPLPLPLPAGATLVVSNIEKREGFAIVTFEGDIYCGVSIVSGKNIEAASLRAGDIVVSDGSQINTQEGLLITGSSYTTTGKPNYKVGDIFLVAACKEIPTKDGSKAYTFANGDNDFWVHNKVKAQLDVVGITNGIFEVVKVEKHAKGIAVEFRLLSYEGREGYNTQLAKCKPLAAVVTEKASA